MRLKQKSYVFAAALPALTTGLTAADIGMQVKNGSEQQEQAEEADARDRQIASQLKKIAESPTPQGQAAGSVMQQRGYASIGGALSTAKGFGKDMWTLAKVYKKPIAAGVVGGTGMAIVGYGVDKGIQANENRLADNRGEERQFTAGSVLSKGFQTLKGAVMENPKQLIGTSLVFGAGFPLIPYATSKMKEASVQKSVMSNGGNNKPQQQQYSAIGAVAGAATKAAKPSFLHRAANRISTTLGGGGFEGVSKFGGKITEIGNKSGNEVTKKVGNWIQAHPKTAVVGSVPVAFGIMGAEMDLGGKPVEKVARLVDKKAYAYQDSQNQVIQ